MGLEIERKFLIKSDSWRALSTQSISIRQGYLCVDPNRTVRVRTWDSEGKITVKGPTTNGSRMEFEYSIPANDAEEMILELCLSGTIYKTRHLIPQGSLIWEIDEFHDHNSGLILAEIELTSIEQEFTIPEWIGTEVTNDHRFYNSFLSRNTLDLPEHKKTI